MKEKCECGKMAQWMYMPSDDGNDPYYCDNCVPRGCSCQEEFVNEDDYLKEILTGDEPMVSRIDEKGRLLPCCEFEYSKEGFNEDQGQGETDEH